MAIPVLSGVATTGALATAAADPTPSTSTTPSPPGTYEIPLTATDTAGNHQTQTLTVIINP